MKKKLLFFVLLFLFFFSSHLTFSFNTRLKQEAVWNLPEILPSHPRIFVRAKSWTYGVSVQDLIKWKNIEPWKSWLSKKPSRARIEEWAIRYLFTKDESLIPRITSYLKKQKYWPGQLTTMATCYDWIFNSPSFSDSDKAFVEKRMVSMAHKAIKKCEYYGDMWSHFGYAPLCDLIMAGLVLYGRRPEAKKFLAYGGGYLKRNLIKGWGLIDGAWMGGWAYYRYSAIYLIKAIYAWSSATSENMMLEIEQTQGNWLKKHIDYLILTKMPDGSPSDMGGFSYSPYRQMTNLSLLILSVAYKDQDGIKYLKDNFRQMDQWWWNGFNFLLFGPQMRKVTYDSYSFPLSVLWSKEGVGYLQMRSGWGRGDTVIEFKCGDYFWSHQFNNQNGFTIYRKGKLAIQSGVYDIYWGEHVLFYYRPSIGSNTVLVIDSKETVWIPPKVAERYRIKTSRRGFFKEFGGQRACYMIPVFGSAETCFTLAKYIFRKEHQHHFETGDISRFKTTDLFTYVKGNATKAYNTSWFSYPRNRPKLELFTREMVFLDKKYLLVFDKIRSTRSGYEKRWLMHTINEPEVLSKRIKVEYEGHRSLYKKGLIEVYEGKGKLYVQPLLPQKLVIRKVGGGATVSKVKRDIGNRGDISLSENINGKFKRLSSTIATDRAKVEKWRIEFESKTRFTLTGSVTGYDGSGTTERHFISKSGAIFIPSGNWKGVAKRGDKLFFKVTSVSNRFFSNNTNHSPDPRRLFTILKDGSKITPGNWRIEVIPEVKKKDTTFLHFMYPCDLSDSFIPARLMFRTFSAVGVSLGDWIVLFALKDRPYRRVNFSFNRQKVKVLFLGLKKDGFYLIKVKGRVEVEEMLVNSDPEGTIFLELDGPATLVLEER